MNGETDGEPGPQGGTSLRSVGSAIDVLECFAVDTELGVSDIARRLGVAKSTAHRMLTTLAARGITEQNPETGRYRLGLRLYELGVLAQSRQVLRAAALPTMRQIAVRLPSDVHLSVPNGADVVFIERIRPRDDDRLQMVGIRLPLHTTSSGKAIAAFNPDVERARREAGFPRRADHTIHNAAEWAAALERVRIFGYAFASDELVNGSASIAVPILDPLHRAIGALSVYGPIKDVVPRTAATVPLLRSASAGISARLRTMRS